MTTSNEKGKKQQPSPQRVMELFMESKRRKKAHFEWMRKNIDKIPLAN